MGKSADAEGYAGAFPLADTATLTRPHLCIVVDAEEDGDGTRSFSRRNTEVGGFHHLWRAQALFERHRIRPCYVATYPIVTDDAAAGLLRGWLERDSCSIGAHLHPWVTPPDEEVACLRNSYPGNLPEELERRKLELLCTAIADRLGQVPKVYKAGRCGIRFERREMLCDLGFEVDASVLPGQDFSGLGGGPNFTGCPSQPFWSDESCRLLHLPITAGLPSATADAAPGPFARARRDRFPETAECLDPPGAASRFGWLDRLRPDRMRREWLGPGRVAIDGARRQVARLTANGQVVFVLSLRSTDFIPGRTPYARNTIEVESLLTRLDQFLMFFLQELGGTATTPLELRQAMQPRQPAIHKAA